jgi:hypothetical protein
MPNQRAKNKALIGAFVDRDLKLALIAKAKAEGLTASEAVTKALHYFISNDSNVSSTPLNPLPKLEPSPDSAQIGPARSVDSSGAATTSAPNVDEFWLL